MDNFDAERQRRIEEFQNWREAHDITPGELIDAEAFEERIKHAEAHDSLECELYADSIRALRSMVRDAVVEVLNAEHADADGLNAYDRQLLHGMKIRY